MIFMEIARFFAFFYPAWYNKAKSGRKALERMEVYLHIPFCKSKCAYCDFSSCAGRVTQMAAYAEAVKREIAAKHNQYGTLPISTVYIGGGTPSLMPAGMMESLLKSLFQAFPLLPGAEVTCEANPGTLTMEFLRMLKDVNVNRISLGVQARQDRHMKMLGRIHRWTEVVSSVSMIRKAGFDNLNLDLMFGLPGQTRGDWRETLEEAMHLSPEHLSMYGLILEEGTPLSGLVLSGKLVMPADDVERSMYEDALAAASQAGFVQYEVSNFALPGRECRHNLGYWQGEYYLGLGAAAHSCMPCNSNEGAYVRFGNISNLDDYIKTVDGSKLLCEEYRVISPREAEFETLMLGLRVVKGVSSADFLCRHGRTMEEAFGEKILQLIKQGMLEYKDGCLRLTRKGMDVQNAVLVELMD